MFLGEQKTNTTQLYWRHVGYWISNNRILNNITLWVKLHYQHPTKDCHEREHAENNVHIKAGVINKASQTVYKNTIQYIEYIFGNHNRLF